MHKLEGKIPLNPNPTKWVTPNIVGKKYEDEKEINKKNILMLPYVFDSCLLPENIVMVEY